MEWFFDPTAWLGLATLVVIEIVLGIDNLIFIAILADKLPPTERDRARIIGLSLALLMRLGLLVSISWLVALTEPLVTIFSKAFSGRDLILFGGGLFLLFKGTMELHQRLESRDEVHSESKVYAGFWMVVTQIVILDAVFSLDAVITAVGMVEELAVMMTAVIIAIILMMIASKPLTRFVNAHRTVIILCLGFLLMIGFSLIAEGVGFHIPKGYLYAAIGFSVLIEVLNQWAQYNRRQFLGGKRPLRERTADAVLRLLGGRVESAELGEDIAVLASAPNGEEIIFNPKERAMIQSVLSLADQPIPALMNPRLDIIWLDLEANAADVKKILQQHSYSRYLVCRGELDQIEGIVQGRDLLAHILEGNPFNLKPVLKQPLFIHESNNALQALEQLRKHPVPMAIVVDEYGGVKGIVTAIDLLASIAGNLADTEIPKIIQETENTWLFEGNSSLNEVKDILKIEKWPQLEGYYTLAGLVLDQLGRVPSVGDKFMLNQHEFKVTSIKGYRINQVRIRKVLNLEAI